MEWIYKDKIKYESSTPNDMKSSSANSRVNDFNAIVDNGSGQGPSEMLTEDDDLDDCAEMDSEVLASSSNQIDDDISKHDENTTIKSLREEVTQFYASYLCDHFSIILTTSTSVLAD